MLSTKIASIFTNLQEAEGHDSYISFYADVIIVLTLVLLLIIVFRHHHRPRIERFFTSAFKILLALCILSLLLRGIHAPLQENTIELTVAMLAAGASIFLLLKIISTALITRGKIIHTPGMHMANTMATYHGADDSAIEFHEVQYTTENKNYYHGTLAEAMSKASAISMSDLQGTIFHVNENFEKLSGYTKGELIGENYRLLSSGHHGRNFWLNMQATIAGGNSWHGEVKNKAKNGTHYWVDTVVFPLFNEQGAIKEYITLQYSLHQEKPAASSAKLHIHESELKTQQEMTNLAIEAGEIGIYSWELNSGKTDWNRYIQEHHGFSSEEFNGKFDNFLERVHPDDREIVSKAFEDTIKRNVPLDIEYRILLNNGSINSIAAKGVLITDDDKKTFKLIGACINITKQKQVEEELKTKQQFFNMAIEAGQIGIWEMNVKTKSGWQNKYASKLFGMSIDTLLTPDKFKNKLHPEDADAVIHAINHSIETGAKYNVEFRVPAESNEYNYVDAHGILLTDKKGSPERMIGICLDVTEQKKLEKTLRESEERFRSAFEHSAIGFALVDPNGKWLKVNDALLGIVGYTETELLSLSLQSITHPDDLEKDEIYMKKLLNGSASSFQLEKRCIHKNGNIVWTQLNGSILQKEVKDSVYFILQFQNITKRRQIEMDMLTINAKLNAHTQKLQAANRELESFSYSVSHDLRAPLRIINEYAKILKDDFSSEINKSALEAAAVISENSVRMKQLIDDLLEFSHMNRLGIEKEPVDMDTEVRKIIHELTAHENDRKFELTIHTLHSCTVDLKMIRQVWINLISNAIKYTRNQSLGIIEIGSVKQSRETCFYVKDNGVGFNMKYATKLFEVFQRLHNSNEFEGTGVGLAIIKRIINRHGGRIWADAKENNGASFYFTIPD